MAPLYFFKIALHLESRRHSRTHKMAPLRHAFVSLLLLVATTLLLAQPFGSSNNGVRADARLLNRATSTAASALHARNGFLVLPLASPRAVGGRDDEESGVDTFASGARAVLALCHAGTSADETTRAIFRTLDTACRGANASKSSPLMVRLHSRTPFLRSPSVRAKSIRCRRASASAVHLPRWRRALPDAEARRRLLVDMPSCWEVSVRMPRVHFSRRFRFQVDVKPNATGAGTSRSNRRRRVRLGGTRVLKVYGTWGKYRKVQQTLSRWSADAEWRHDYFLEKAMPVSVAPRPQVIVITDEEMPRAPVAKMMPGKPGTTVRSVSTTEHQRRTDAGNAFSDDTPSRVPSMESIAAFSEASGDSHHDEDENAPLLSAMATYEPIAASHDEAHTGQELQGSNPYIARVPATSMPTLPRPPHTSDTHLNAHAMGMVNTGNTCYMNAVLQSLLASRSFLAKISTPAYNRFPNKSMLLAVRNLVNFARYPAQTAQTGAITTEHPPAVVDIDVIRRHAHFMSNVGEFMKGVQSDAAEFAHTLVETIMQQYRIVFDPNAEDFYCWHPLGIYPGEPDVNTLDMLLMMDEQKMYMDITRPLLIIHLTRFEYIRGLIVKRRKVVVYPRRLEMHGVVYNLVGEVFHHGDIATLGHYTARTCLSMPENATPKCTYFDDEHVTHGALPRGLDMKPQRDAYLLFYERMEQ